MSALHAALALHLASVAVAGVRVWRRCPGEPLRRAEALAVALAFPVAGPLAVGWLDVRDAAPAWQDTLEAPPAPEPAGPDLRQTLRRELAVRPFADQLRQGARDARQSAARALGELGDAGSVAVLEAALHDADADTRLFASLAIVKLEAAFAARLADARTTEDPLALARVIASYLASGLPRGSAAASLWGELGAAGAALEDSAEAWTHVATARRASQDLPGAREAARRSLALSPSAPAALLLCETLWEQADYAALVDAAACLATLAPPASAALDAARMWAGPGAPP